MDDEDSKIRRNLVVASTLVVLAWWLRLPLDKLSEKMFGVSSAPGLEWRVWLAAIVVLLYLLHRFRFAGEAAGAFVQWRNSRSNLRQELIQRHFEKRMATYTKNGLPFHEVGEPLKQRVNEILSELAARQGVEPGHLIVDKFILKPIQHGSLTKAGLNVKPSKRVGSMHCDLAVRSATSLLPPKAFVLNYELSKQRYSWIQCKLFLRTGTYSPAATALVLPYVLAVVALALAAWKLFRAL